MSKNIEIINILSTLPDKTTLEVVEACFILAFLTKNKGNKSKTCREIKVSLRKMRYKLIDYEFWGYDIPPPIGHFKKRE